MAATLPRRGDVDDAQVVLLTDALARPRPHTSGSPSVFQRAVPKRAVGAPDPKALRRIDGPPPEPKSNPRSAWQAVYDALSTDHGLEMTRDQALALAAWARQHKLRVTRRKINGDTYGVWRNETR